MEAFRPSAVARGLMPTFSVYCGGLRIPAVPQIFIERSQFFVIHFSNGTPRHLLAHLMTPGIGTGTHRGYEFLESPVLYKIQVGPYRPQLAWYAAGQISAVAFRAIEIPGYIFAILYGGALWRC